MHLASADARDGIHAALQYRDAGDSEWGTAMQTVCGLRKFSLAGARGEWCDVCHSAWKSNG